MKLTFNWLKEFIELKESPQRIAEALTMAGLEVESVISLRDPKGGPADCLMEVAVTPNRGDCLGILGLAREIAAVVGGHLRLPPISSHASETRGKGLVDVKIRSPRLCPRYSARTVEGIHVSSSPPWMRFRLEACGIRSINNVVDTTNYVMLETGQPLHAFDIDRLTTKRVVVRQAGEIERFVTLDGIERELAQEDLLICDGDTPIALAGVMGGKESEVRSHSRAVLLESAHFDPLSVRRTAKRLGLRSEASHRFERGVDPAGTLYALDRAAFLLGQISGAVPHEVVVDRYPRPMKGLPILVRDEKVKGLLGVELPRKKVERILKSLGSKIQGRSKSGLKVLPPSYRRDLTREVDLIEELARIYSYGRIPSTLPRVRPEAKTDLRLRRERRIRSFLIGEGLTELINLPFASAVMNGRFYGLRERRGLPVSVLNPLIQDNADMRLSLIPGLIGNLRVNLGQRVKGFCGFDIGKVFWLDPKGSPAERQHLAGLLYGQRERRGLRTKETPLTFLDLKGLVEGVLEIFRIEHDVDWTSTGVGPFLHPGKAGCLQLDDSRLGYLGEVHPDLREELDLPPFLIFELDFEGLVQYSPSELTARSLPRFPSVERDLAMIVDEAFSAQRIISWIKDLNHALIEDVQLFDQYRGAPIPEGKKSLAYTISYRAEDRTLTDGEVNGLHQHLISQIGDVFGAQLRG